MFVGRWWYFLEKCWKTGWSEQDVRDRRMLPRMATGAVPVRIRTATRFSPENSHRETWHLGRMFRSPWAFVEFMTNLRYEPCKVKTTKIIQKHLTRLHSVVKMHKNNVADLMTIYKLPINYRKSLATDSWMCYLLITATETLPGTIPIPIPKQ